METIKKYLPYIFLLGFIAYKIQDLFLPYYWDEAWSYIPAIIEMKSNGPSLLPNSISPELYRGHPLLFYFLSSIWMKFSGTHIWAARLFPLIISGLFLSRFFVFARKRFDYNTAIISLFVLIIQSVFIAQATFFLPEMLLALFTILSLDTFLDKKYFQTIVWLTLALYTKESAIVIWGVIFCWRFMEVLFEKNKSKTYFLKNSTLFLLPLLLITIFFFLQKMKVGWLFFPEHISYFTFNELFNRLNGYASYLFVYMGRNLLTFSGIFALIFLLYKKDKELIEKKKQILFLFFFIMSYLLFSSLNFYSPRYLLSILPLVILIWMYFIMRFVQRLHIVISILLLSIIAINNLYFTINKKDGSDHTLGYRNMIAVQSQMISYCEDIEIYDKEIQANFLMSNYLTNANLGYLKSNKLFLNVNSHLSENTDYAIFSSNELDNNLYDSIKTQFPLVKRYNNNSAWVELYKISKEKRE